MADRQANFANNWSSVLDAEMGPTDLTATVASTTGAPSSPCYLLLDHDDDAKREYIYFDGTFTATDFVTLSTGNRYLAGSAAGSGITHASGATVRAITAAQALEDLHDRIDATATDLDDHDHDDEYLPLGSSTIPSGAIVMWSGTESNIPSGWVFCDGTNGTPDLRARFIRGSYELLSIDPGEVGGDASHDHGDTGTPSDDLIVAAGSGSGASTPSHTHATSSASSVPPFYVLAFIMKT